MAGHLPPQLSSQEMEVTAVILDQSGHQTNSQWEFHCQLETQMPAVESLALEVQTNSTNLLERLIYNSTRFNYKTISKIIDHIQILGKSIQSDNNSINMFFNEVFGMAGA